MQNSDYYISILKAQILFSDVQAVTMRVRPPNPEIQSLLALTALSYLTISDLSYRSYKLA